MVCLFCLSISIGRENENIIINRGEKKKPMTWIYDIPDSFFESKFKSLLSKNNKKFKIFRSIDEKFHVEYFSFFKF